MISIKNTALYVVLFLSLLFVLLLITNPKTSALSGNDFNPSNIISDSVFYNDNSMSPQQIQQFLNSKVPTCDTNGTQPYGGTTRAAYGASRGYPAPYTCLKDYSQNIPAVTNGGSDLCKNSITAGTKSAAQIIWDVSKSCDINPQVLLVMLQKEMSLITDDWPWPSQYDKAMGYACPDSGPNNSANCDSAFFGFFNQVYNAAQAYRRYEANPGSYNYRAGRNNFVLYNPNTSCGGTTIYIENQATANLYIYTPYQPNAAALANLYGTGDSCSAYGNRNFWRLFNDWFGSTQGVRVIPVPFDQTTDNSGELGKVGFMLSKRPNSDVFITYNIVGTSQARIVGNGVVKFTKNNWDKPEQNTLNLVGMNDANETGNVRYWLVPKSNDPTTTDTRYASLSSEQVGSVSMLSQDVGERSIFRLANPNTSKYYYSANLTEVNQLVSEGWVNEGIKFNSCHASNTLISALTDENDDVILAVTGSQNYKDLLSEGYTVKNIPFSSSGYGSVSIYKLYDQANNRHLYSTNPNEGSANGFVNQGVAFNSCGSNQEPVYRLVNYTNGARLFTQSTSELYNAVFRNTYRYESLGFYVCESGNTNVFRLVNPTNGQRLFTVSPTEKSSAVNTFGFRDEGVGFKVCNNSNRDVFRLVNPTNGQRLFTVSPTEKSSAVNTFGFRDEGVGFKSE